jgi:hypothetical protein
MRMESSARNVGVRDCNEKGYIFHYDPRLIILNVRRVIVGNRCIEVQVMKRVCGMESRVGMDSITRGF